GSKQRHVRDVDKDVLGIWHRRGTDVDNVARHGRRHGVPDGRIARIIATRAWGTIKGRGRIDTIHPTGSWGGQGRSDWPPRGGRRRRLPLAGGSQIRDRREG